MFGTPPYDVPEYRVTLALNTPCGLSDGLYWVEVYYNSGMGYDDWWWESGTADPVYGVPLVAYALENPGVYWDVVTIAPWIDVAIQLNGTVGTAACVDSSVELQAALTAAGGNGADDVIQVVEGTYLTPGAPFSYTTSESFGLQLLGGFTPGCTDRAVAPANTILDGDELTPVLRVEPGASTNGALHLQGFTIQHRLATGAETAGLEVGGLAGFNGRVTIDHNIIRDNRAASGVAGDQGSHRRQHSGGGQQPRRGQRRPLRSRCGRAQLRR